MWSSAGISGEVSRMQEAYGEALSLHTGLSSSGVRRKLPLHLSLWLESPVALTALLVERRASLRRGWRRVLDHLGQQQVAQRLRALQMAIAQMLQVVDEIVREE